MVLRVLKMDWKEGKMTEETVFIAGLAPRSLAGLHLKFLPALGLFGFWLWAPIEGKNSGLSSLLQHHNFKTSVLRHSTFMLQFSHPTTTEKTMALTLQTFVSKVIALFLNMLSRFVIAFLPRSVFEFYGYCYRLQWFWSPRKTICHCFHFFPSICQEVMGPDAMILDF